MPPCSIRLSPHITQTLTGTLHYINILSYKAFLRPSAMQSSHELHVLRHLSVVSDRFIGLLPLISRPSRFNISDDEASGKGSVPAGLANKKLVCRRAGLICQLQSSDDCSKQFNQLRIRRNQFQGAASTCAMLCCGNNDHRGTLRCVRCRLSVRDPLRAASTHSAPR